jgi:hypothetical protein
MSALRKSGPISESVKADPIAFLGHDEPQSAVLRKGNCNVEKQDAEANETERMYTVRQKTENRT